MDKSCVYSEMNLNNLPEVETTIKYIVVPNGIGELIVPDVVNNSENVNTNIELKTESDIDELSINSDSFEDDSETNESLPLESESYKSSDLSESDSEKNCEDEPLPLALERYKCPVCLRFVTYIGLKRHELIHAGKDPFNCEICGKTYPSRTSLDDHQIKHNKECIRPYNCEICGKWFAHNEMMVHKKTHTKDLPYQCSICSYKSIDIYDMSSHMSSHTRHNPNLNTTIETESTEKEVDSDINIVKNEIDDLTMKSEIISDILNDKSINANSEFELKSETTIKSEISDVNLANFATNGSLKIQSRNHMEETDKFKDFSEIDIVENKIDHLGVKSEIISKIWNDESINLNTEFELKAETTIKSEISDVNFDNFVTNVPLKIQSRNHVKDTDKFKDFPEIDIVENKIDHLGVKSEIISKIWNDESINLNTEFELKAETTIKSEISDVNFDNFVTNVPLKIQSRNHVKETHKFKEFAEIDIVKNEIDHLAVKSEIISQILNDKSINIKTGLELKAETTIKTEISDVNSANFATNGPFKIQSTNHVNETNKFRDFSDINIVKNEIDDLAMKSEIISKILNDESINANTEFELKAETTIKSEISDINIDNFATSGCLEIQSRNHVETAKLKDFSEIDIVKNEMDHLAEKSEIISQILNDKSINIKTGLELKSETTIKSEIPDVNFDDGDKIYELSINADKLIDETHIKTEIGDNILKDPDYKPKSSSKDEQKQDGSVSTSKPGQRSFKCPICSRYLSAIGLKNHEMMHSRKTTFYCKICDKTYASQSYFRVHQTKHGIGSEFLCEVCGKIFVQNFNLKRKICERPYQCTFCLFEATSESLNEPPRNHVRKKFIKIAPKVLN